MRIERKGQVGPLTPRVQRFLVEALAGISLDDILSPEERRADYVCLRGLLAVELKRLEKDASERMGNLVNELRQREDWPHFIGPAPLQAALTNTSDPEGLMRRARQRLGRAAVTHLKHADEQLEAHAQRFPRRSQVRALVLVNEDHADYDPHIISHILWQQLRRTENGVPLYPYVDLVIYLTERHATVVDRSLTFPVVIVQGFPADAEPWKEAVGDFFVRRWGRWNGLRLATADGKPEFTAMEHVPESMPRHEAWRLDYRRNPYFRSLSVEELRDRFDEVMLLSVLAFVHGSPLKPSPEVVSANLERFTHISVEMSDRALPATKFPADKDRDIAAARRLGLPDAVVRWLETRGEAA